MVSKQFWSKTYANHCTRQSRYCKERLSHKTPSLHLFLYLENLFPSAPLHFFLRQKKNHHSPFYTLHMHRIRSAVQIRNILSYFRILIKTSILGKDILFNKLKFLFSFGRCRENLEPLQNIMLPPKQVPDQLMLFGILDL